MDGPNVFGACGACFLASASRPVEGVEGVEGCRGLLSGRRAVSSVQWSASVNPYFFKILIPIFFEFLAPFRSSAFRFLGCTASPVDVSHNQVKGRLSASQPICFVPQMATNYVMWTGDSQPCNPTPNRASRIFSGAPVRWSTPGPGLRHVPSTLRLPTRLIMDGPGVP